MKREMDRRRNGRIGWSYYFLLSCLLLLVTLRQADVVNGFIISCPTNNQCSSPSIRYHQSSTTTCLFSVIQSKTDLESMSVNDLKSLLRSENLYQRGLLSKLNRKQDLVNFLSEKLLNDGTNVDNVVVVAKSSSTTSTTGTIVEKEETTTTPSSPGGSSHTSSSTSLESLVNSDGSIKDDSGIRGSIGDDDDDNINNVGIIGLDEEALDRLGDEIEANLPFHKKNKNRKRNQRQQQQQRSNNKSINNNASPLAHNSNNNNNNNMVAQQQEDGQRQRKQRPSRLLSMPPLNNINDKEPKQSSLDHSIVQHEEDTSRNALKKGDDQQEQEPDSRTLSKKQEILERVYKIYPPLQEAVESGNHSHVLDSMMNPDSGNDIRQQYHPMLKNLPWYDTSYTNIVSSTMDLMTIGTASCNPGVTRGVSCTALRINDNQASQERNKGAEYFKDVRASAAAGSNSKDIYDDDNNNDVGGGVWLFDVGESTQLQLQRTGMIRPSRIRKIFLTHSHGDHTFGLPGLMCVIGSGHKGIRQNSASETSTSTSTSSSPPIDIYGPEGLRMWLRTAIRYSVSKICPKYRVHELKDVPMGPEWCLSNVGNWYFSKRFARLRDRPWPIPMMMKNNDRDESWISVAQHMPLERSERYGEVEGGRDIYPDYDHPACSHGAPLYFIEENASGKLWAAPMSHGVPCVGYVFEEHTRQGRLRNEIVEPIVRRNLQRLKEEMGYTIPMKVMAVLKNLKPGQRFEFPDGTIVTHEEALEGERRGRKVVICGDTCHAKSLEGLAQGADVVVHEATNTFLEGIDNEERDERTVERLTRQHGHSTPRVAARFCNRVGAKRLVMNHFSSRYKGDSSVESTSIMTRMEWQAMEEGNLRHDQVMAAWDFMVLPIPKPEDEAEAQNP